MLPQTESVRFTDWQVEHLWSWNGQIWKNKHGQLSRASSVELERTVLYREEWIRVWAKGDKVEFFHHVASKPLTNTEPNAKCLLQTHLYIFGEGAHTGNAAWLPNSSATAKKPNELQISEVRNVQNRGSNLFMPTC